MVLCCCYFQFGNIVYARVSMSVCVHVFRIEFHIQWRGQKRWAQLESSTRGDSPELKAIRSMGDSRPGPLFKLVPMTVRPRSSASSGQGDSGTSPDVTKPSSEVALAMKTRDSSTLVSCSAVSVVSARPTGTLCVGGGEGWPTLDRN